MVTESLHCRLLALTNGDFDSVVRTARQFGKPTTGFEQTPSILAWDELLSFQAGDWKWASDIPAIKVKLRIAVFHIGSLPTSVGVYGIISGFSSLSNAGRNYIMRPFIDNRVSLQVNFGTLIGDQNLQTALVGYSYEEDGIFHTLSNISPGTLLTKVATGPSPNSTLHSVRLTASSALIEVNNDLEINVTAEDSTDPNYAIEDSKRIFEMITPHVTVLRD
jgi:hypothetical protein